MAEASAHEPLGKLIDVTPLQKRLREFAKARDWEQFHTPKNLAVPSQ